MRYYKRGEVWWYEFVRDGQRYQRSTKVRNKRTAETIAEAFRTALSKGDVGITERKPAPSFQDAMASFLEASKRACIEHPSTAERYRYSSYPLLRHFKKVKIDTITREHVEAFRTARAAEHGSHTGRALRPATVNREIAALRAMFNHAITKDPELRNPCTKLKPLAEQNEQDRVISFPEQRLYLAAATPMLKDVALLILETGCRPDEVFRIKKGDVGLKEGTLHIRHGKTPAARRKLFLSAVARGILSRRFADAQGVYLFPCENDPNRSLPNVHSSHQRALRASKVAPFKLYACRHTFATRAVEAGMDSTLLAGILGHARLNMITRYVHPGETHRAAAMQSLERYNALREVDEAGVSSSLQ